ncbi:GAF domain-containing protein [Methanolobus sp. ZRKC3]|uniref:GAF domain-containing protein n=1 Tax=Methanolobus sp. ZRKC3 TaxID=3125786 RepID=UPI003252E914
MTFLFLISFLFYTHGKEISRANTALAFHISEKKKTDENLLRKYEIEANLSRLSTNFAYSTDLDTTIDDALETLGHLFNASRSYVFFFREDEEVMDNVYEWCADGIEPQKTNLRGLAKAIFPWWIAKLEAKEIIQIPDIRLLPPEALAERNILEKQDIRSVLSLPLHVNGKLSGFVGFDNVFDAGKWQEEDINALEMFANSLGMALKENQVARSLHDKEESLSHQLHFESLISDISINFLSLEPENIDDGINKALEKISKFLDIDRSYIFLFSDDKANISNTHEWCADGIETQKEKMQNIPTRSIPEFTKKLSGLNALRVPNVEHLLDQMNGYEKEMMINREVKSLIVIPMVYKDDVMGLLGLDNIRTKREWSENSVRLMTVLAQMFVAALNRKKDSEQLKLEREQLLSIFDSIDEIIYVADPCTYEVLYANKYLRERIGSVPLGKKCYEAFRNFDSPCEFCTNDSILKNKNGSHQWSYYNSFMESGFAATDRIIRWPDGRKVRLEVAQDVTNLKKAEEYARKSEEKFEKILENSPAPIVIIDLEGNIEYANRNFIDTFGYTMHDIHTMKQWWLNASPDMEYTKKRIEGIEETNISREWIFKCKDGSVRNVEFHFAVTTEQVIIVMNDITERKKVEKALLLDESRLEAIQKLNQMSDLSTNEIEDFALEEAIRLTQSKVGYLAFFDEETNSLIMVAWSTEAMKECRIKDRKIVYELSKAGIWGEAVRQRKPIITNNFESPNPLKRGYPAGHVHIKRHMNIPIMDAGKVIGIAGVGNKVEEYNQSDVRQLTLLMQGMYSLIKRKEAEENLNKYAEQLGEVNIELSIANDELKSLDELKSNFLSRISHELKTPLIPILGFSELVADGTLGTLNAEQKKAMDTVFHSSGQLKRLIESLIFMSSLNAKQFSYEFDPIKVSPIIEKTLNIIILENRDKRIGVELNIQDEMYTINGDTNYLTELFLHLIDNAFKFTSSTGKISITGVNENKNVHFIVEDTGIGIPQNMIRKTFDSFYQVDGSLSRKYSGTGIGLNMCKRIAEDHGGKLWIESEENVGTKVHVELPSFTENSN